MDWFPLYNSLRVALISTAAALLLGTAAAYGAAKLPGAARRAADTVLTLPLLLPPTVAGYLLLLFFGPRHLPGSWLANLFGTGLTMQWWSAVPAALAVVFPLMYRIARDALGQFDEIIADAGLTLGLPEFYIFWRVRIPCCARGLLTGALLCFARALGEYGVTAMLAGYIPGRTATLSTEVYQLWRVGNDSLALRWVLVNLLISATILLGLNLLEGRKREP